VTSILSGTPLVAFLLWTPLGEHCADFDAVRVAITIDHDVRWTARSSMLLGDIVVLDVDRGDLDALGEALDGAPTQGGAPSPDRRRRSPGATTGHFGRRRSAAAA
jgi:hypothetical protein